MVQEPRRAVSRRSVSVSILQQAKPQQQPFTALLKAVASVDSRVLSSPCMLHSCTQEITKPGIQWWFHLFCNGQWRQEAGRDCKGCIILVLYAFRPRNCPAWAWSCQTSSWQRNRQWPFSSSPANPIRRPNGFLKNNVITRGLISCLFCWLCQHVMLRPGRLQGFSWLLEFWAICPSLYPPCPGSIKKSCAEWKEQEGGSQEVWVFQFQLCLRQLERAGL